MRTHWQVRCGRGVVLATALAVSCVGASAQEKSNCSEDAMLVFDASQSMAAADASNAGLRRIDSVRAALAKFLPRVAPKRRIGLVTYGPGGTAACANVSVELLPAANAGREIHDAVAALKPAGRTPLTRAVAMAADALGYRERPATIVLLTDGEETCRGEPCALARTLKARGAGITVHVVSYRIKSSLGSSGVFGAMCLAEETGGQYYSTETAEELAAALEKVLACPLLSDTRSFRSRSAASAR